MSSSALSFSKVVKKYGRATALHEVTFDIARGEFFGLVGVNGAGKTTLLKCLLDLCAFDDGGIEIFGIPHRLRTARARMAFLPERFMPPYYSTGEDFVRYVLALQSVDYDRAAAEQLLQALDLDRAALQMPARAYSKGMTQKLGLAASFLAHKDLYVLDEPTSGLDPKARALLKAQLRQIKQRGGTLLLTSHALADVAEICDRMAVLHAGRVLFVGTPDELCRQYASSGLEAAFLHCIEQERPAA
ncbi:MAG TPA: ABC transporter ATP-binding protein [Burkholderiales bacterium]|nr:ABC transporter ATP-binding protein [Burkholderiales bacterium]